MTIKSKIDLLQEQIGHRKLEEWNQCWEPLPNAFTESHADLRQVVGLFRTILNGDTKYIVAASDQGGGIAKGLRRIAGPEQTGNKGYGAQKVREHLDLVVVEILRVDDENSPSNVTKKLKRMMLKYYDPEWAWTSRRRTKAIRAGNINV